MIIRTQRIELFRFRDGIGGQRVGAASGDIANANATISDSTSRMLSNLGFDVSNVLMFRIQIVWF